jgi:hypothetical protein
VLEAVFGDQAVRRLATNARKDLNRRMRALMDTERTRFTEILDALQVTGESEEALRSGARKVDDLRFASGAR